MPNEFKIKNGLIIDQGGAYITGTTYFGTTGFTSSAVFSGNSIGAISLSTTGSTGFSVLTSSGTFSVYDNTNAATRFYIGSNGDIGVGTTSPGAKLDVTGEIKAGRIDTSNEGGQISFGRASDNTRTWYIDSYGNTSTPDLRFVNDTTVVMRLKGDGTVAIESSGTPAAPASAGTPVEGYGVDNTKYMGEPSIWLKISIGGATYYFPGYE